LIVTREKALVSDDQPRLPFDGTVWLRGLTMTDKVEEAQKSERTDKVAELTDLHVVRDPIAGLLAQYVVYGSLAYITLISVVGLYQGEPSSRGV
jgi:hypothetical protein